MFCVNGKKVKCKIARQKNLNRQSFTIFNARYKQQKETLYLESVTKSKNSAAANCQSACISQAEIYRGSYLYDIGKHRGWNCFSSRRSSA